MSPILYPTNHAGQRRQQNVSAIFTRIRGRARKNCKIASVPFEDVSKEVTRTETEERNKTLVKRKATQGAKLLSQRSTVSRHAVTCRGKFSHLLNKGQKDIQEVFTHNMLECKTHVFHLCKKSLHRQEKS